MFKAFLILSISILMAVLSLKPAMAAGPKTNAKAKLSGKLIAQNSVNIAQTEASAGNSLAADSTASGINLSKIPMGTLPQLEEPKKSFSLTLGAERASDLTAENADGDQTNTSFMIMPKYQITENLSTSVRSFIVQQENGPRNTELSDTQINFTLKGPKLSEKISTNYYLNGIAPTSESNRKDTRFQGAGNIGFRLIGSYTFADLSYGLSYRRNVHEYTVSAAGTANIRDVIAQTVLAEVPVSQQFSLSFSGVYRNSWTYQNSSRQGFSFDADVNFEAAKDLSFNVGTSNEGSALKANGKDSNVQFYDEKSSVIRAGVTYVL